MILHLLHFVLIVLLGAILGIILMMALLATFYFVSNALLPFPPKPDYKRIEAMERELHLGPPFISDYPQIEKPIKIERIW